MTAAASVYLLDQGHVAEFLLPSPDPILDDLGVPR